MFKVAEFQKGLAFQGKSKEFPGYLWQENGWKTGLER